MGNTRERQAHTCPQYVSVPPHVKTITQHTSITLVYHATVMLHKSHTIQRLKRRENTKLIIPLLRNYTAQSCIFLEVLHGAMCYKAHINGFEKKKNPWLRSGEQRVVMQP